MIDAENKRESGRLALSKVMPVSNFSQLSKCLLNGEK